MFKFQCDYLKIGGRKHPDYLQKMKVLIKLTCKQRNSLLQSIQLCKTKMSLKLCDKLICCSKTVIFSRKQGVAVT